MKSRIKTHNSSALQSAWSQFSDRLNPLGEPQFKGHYWSLEINHKQVESIRHALEKWLGYSLKHRTETHITLITPPEWTTLSALALQPSSPPSWPKGPHPFRVLCLAETKNSSQLATYYLVVEMNQAFAWREKLFSQKGLIPPAYFPHITIGFTERDLHLKDGIPNKDQSQCLNLTPEDLNVTI